VSEGTDDVDPYGGYGNWYNDAASDEDGHHNIDDIIEDSLELTPVVTLAGEPFVNRLVLDDDDAEIVQEDPFERDPDPEEFDGYTGNESATATHVFRETVSAIPTM